MPKLNNGMITSFENILLKNKNVASHPQLASMLDNYSAAVAGGYTPPSVVIDSLLHLDPKSPLAQASFMSAGLSMISRRSQSRIPSAR